MDRETLLQDFMPFCDIGEQAPKISQGKDSLAVKITRDGKVLKISINNDSGKVQVENESKGKKGFSSIEAMFASDIFANLKKWADAQKELLKKESSTAKSMIPVNGKYSDGSISKDVTGVENIDDVIESSSRVTGSTEIILIDGPAGVGKTSLIEKLAYRRAEMYKETGCSLILHVKSRGRVLSNLQDLMAFSLQTIRSHITYDQIPVLAKYGLVTIAVDGFDELGDPNGYEMAWGQLGELVNQVRHKGKLILAGRDTFIGRSRIVRDVKSITADDVVVSLTLIAPSAAQAKEWLAAKNWSKANIESSAVSDLLEDGSFALRPVFLALLGSIKPRQLSGKDSAYVSELLIDAMIERESKLFGAPVNAVISNDEMKKFIWNFMCEISRDMADSQTEALETSVFGWLAEMALGAEVNDEVLGLIKHRAAVIGFLVQDERPGYLTFMHSQVMNYFLSHVTIEAIEKGEVPKYIRRNLFGADFLSSFIDVAIKVGANERPKLDRFMSRAINFSHSHVHIDRGGRNVGALVISALPYVSEELDLTVRNYDVDDAKARGTYPNLLMENCTISQLDCRGADLSRVTFSGVKISSVIADDATRFCSSFPTPTFITDGEGSQVQEGSIDEWLSARGRNTEEISLGGFVSTKLRKHPIYALLSKACRLRQYWLRLEDDLYAEKILKDQHWDELRQALLKHGFLKEEVRAASGRSPTFYHIRHKERILAANSDDDAVRALMVDLSNAI